MKEIIIMMIISNIGFALTFLSRQELVIKNKTLRQENALLKREKEILLNERLK